MFFLNSASIKKTYCVVFLAWGYIVKVAAAMRSDWLYRGQDRSGCVEEPLIFTHCRPDCLHSQPGPILLCFFGDKFWKEETPQPSPAHMQAEVPLHTFQFTINRLSLFLMGCMGILVYNSDSVSLYFLMLFTLFCWRFSTKPKQLSS